MNTLRAKSNCKLCPYSSRKKIHSISGDEPRIAVISEAPGIAEENEGKGYSGPEAKLLNKVFYEAKVKHNNLWMTYLLPCRPTDCSMRSLDTEDALLCCKAGFTEEMLEMQRRGVKVVVAQGEYVASALGLEGKLKDIRGSVYELAGMYVVATYAPMDCIRNSGRRESGGLSHLAAFIEDWKKAADIAINSWKTPEERFEMTPDFNKLRSWITKAIEDDALIAIDIETTGLDPKRSDIVVIGLARDSEDAISVPLIDGHNGRYWGVEDEAVKQLVNMLFRKCNQVYQNCFFDVPFMRQHGYVIPQDKIQHDTMLLHAILSPETEHNLGFITSVYGRTAYWKDSFKTRKGTILDMDQIEMRQYNLRDCVVLHQVLKPMLEDLKKYELEDLYYKEQIPFIAIIMEMMSTGVKFDFSRMGSFKRLMEKEIERLKGELDEHLGHSYCNYDSDDELRYILFGIEPKKFGKIEEIEKKKKGTKVYAELESLQKLRDAGRPSYTLTRFNGIKTDGGKIAVSKEGLLSFRIALQNRRHVCEELKDPKVDEVARIDGILEFLDRLESYSSCQKLLTSFTKYSPDADSRIRPSWLIHGTATGRISCKNPNLMQIPKEGTGKDIRNFFVTDPGWSMVSADFENAEVALLGYDAQDPIIIDIYENNRNIHDENTKLLFGIDDTHPMWKNGRAAAKIFQFGGLSYGGSIREIHRKVCMKAPNLKITYGEFEKAIKTWMAAHAAYVEWKEKTLAEVREKRIIYNAFGRMRSFLGNDNDIGKEAMNFRIQSAGANLLNRAAIRLFNRIKTAQLKAKFIMQIHDQLVLECPDEEVETIKLWLQEEMERPFEMHGRQCKIRAEVSSGKAFGQLD